MDNQKGGGISMKSLQKLQSKFGLKTKVATIEKDVKYIQSEQHRQ